MHDAESDCTEEQAKCDRNGDLGIEDSGGVMFSTNSLSIPEIGVPTICINIYRGQSCDITCRNGWYFSGARSCSCSFTDGTCALSGGQCKRCPQLDTCGGGNSHGEGIWAIKNPENSALPKFGTAAPYLADDCGADDCPLQTVATADFKRTKDDGTTEGSITAPMGDGIITTEEAAEFVMYDICSCYKVSGHSFISILLQL
jgi:hypothetical protein